MSMLVTDVNDPDKLIGNIGFDSDGKYFVRSRLIQNEKYGQWNTSQHQSKFSKHMKNIVKEAMKALKPISYDEVKVENEGAVNRAIDQRSRQVVAKSNACMKMDFVDVFPELLHMYNTGYIPSNPKFAEAIKYSVENKEELEKYYRYNPKKVMIWVRPNSVTYQEGEQITQVNSVAELPEELRGKLFVLDVTDNGQFVEDVGLKQDTGIYWVLLEEK
jgi:citrate lyase gamma subunit